MFRAPTPEDVALLVDAGFTAQELLDLSETLQFIATLAEAGETDAHARTRFGHSAEKWDVLMRWAQSLRVDSPDTPTA